MNQPGKSSTTETQRHGEIHSKKPDSSNIFFGFNLTTFGYSLFYSVPPCLRGSAVVLLFLISTNTQAADWKCTPTPHDEIGPFYRPNAPLRSKIGDGYVLSGTVRSAATCLPIPGARIEFWQAGAAGKYADAYRATIIADQRGHYRLTTAFPPPYARRPSHIHILVDMRGYAGLITQHYLQAGKRSATFDLVLETE